MPGVQILTGTRPGDSSLAVAPGTPFFVAGLTERGDPTQAVRVRSLSEYVSLFGPRVTYGAVYDALEAYFNEGGTAAFVARVVGGAATIGTLSLVDRSGGAGLATLTVTAKNAGAWSANVSVQIDDGPNVNTFKVSILYAGVVVEVYNNLATPAAAAALISATSAYVNVADAGSVTAAPANNPKVLVATALSAGADDRATVTAAAVAAAAVARFTADLGPGMVACPGYDGTTIGPVLAPDALAKNRLVALAPPAGSTVAQVRTAAAATRGIVGSECCGMFYPWVQVPDGFGGLRTVSPEGFVAGVRARVQAELGAGPGQAPAGEYGRARHVVGVAQVIDAATANSLNDDNISVIRLIGGATKLYGWRSLSTDAANYLFLSARDVLNYIAGQGAIVLESVVFGKIDGRGQLFDRAGTAIRGICEPLRANGDLYERHAANGDLIDPGFRIDTGVGVNTPATIAAGQVRVNCAARPSPTGELVILSITRVTLTQAA